MNNRIFEIIQQMNGDFGLAWNEQQKTDLARAVVNEICDIVNKHVQWNNPNDCLLVLDIKEHFGIEESRGWVCPKCGTDRTKERCPEGYTAAAQGLCPMTGTAQ